KEIKMNDNLGTPFGTLISSKEITENNIDNIKYTLKIKPKIFNYSIIFFILVALLLISNIEKIYLKYFIGMNKRYLYIIILFLCFLILPRIVYISFYESFDHKNYENRNFSKYPDINSSFIDYPQEYEAYFNDYLPFKNEMIQIKNLIDIYIFRNLVSDRVLLGKEGWFFYKSKNIEFENIDILKFYMGMELYDDSELKMIKENLLDVQSCLSNNGSDFYVFIAPEQKEIYYDYMPNYILKGKFTRTDLLVKYLSNNGIKIVYPKNDLLKYKNKYQLYNKYDLHWNNIGAFIANNVLLKKIGKGNLLLIDRVQINTNYFYDKSSLSMLALDKYIKDDKGYSISGFTSKYLDVNIILNGGLLYGYNSNSDDSRKILVIGDSFGHLLSLYSSRYFNESYYAYFNIISNQLIVDMKPDIVIFELLEYRDIRNYYSNFFR
uniref:alginate O-acetyltransferase AlgX-related protein n=1 Tax=uncultured Brachyspira sp. TaxID=221953 RepID=UPI0026234AEC